VFHIVSVEGQYERTLSCQINTKKHAQTVPLGLSQELLGKTVDRKYILRQLNKDFQHSSFSEHSSIKIGLNKGMGNGKKKAPGVTM